MASDAKCMKPIPAQAYISLPRPTTKSTSVSIVLQSWAWAGLSRECGNRWEDVILAVLVLLLMTERSYAHVSASNSQLMTLEKDLLSSGLASSLRSLFAVPLGIITIETGTLATAFYFLCGFARAHHCS